jgi:hypothetical protein
MFLQRGRIAGLCLIIAACLATISTINTVKQGLPPPLSDGSEFSSVPSFKHKSVIPPPSIRFALSQSSHLLVNAQHERFDPLIEEAARYFGIDFHLIKAIIKTESEFNPRAVSSHGARGLMQVMPRTARGLGVRNLLEPRVNIFTGVQYYKQLLIQVKGDHRLALAAYNAGITRIKKCGGVPRIATIRSYLNKVLDCAELYRASFISPSAAPDGKILNNSEVQRTTSLRMELNRDLILQASLRGKTDNIISRQLRICIPWAPDSRSEPSNLILSGKCSDT